MRLGLSSAAAPDASLDELLEICARRGLAELELRDGDGHGVAGGSGGLAGDTLGSRARAAGVAIRAFRSGDAEADLRLAPVAAAVRATLLVDGRADLASRIARAHRLASRGAAVAVVVADGASLGELSRTASRVQVAWDVDASVVQDLGVLAEVMLREGGERLCHVRILGGGPEAVLHEGRGVGEMMTRLALAGYQGSLVLAPSSPRYRVAWQNWLGRRGWGCGSGTADARLVSLAAAPTGGAS